MSYFHLGKDFFPELVDPKNAVKRRAIRRTEAANKF
jgi:hypothetical protein